MPANDIFRAMYQRYALFRGAEDAYTLTGGTASAAGGDGRMYRTIAKPKADRPYIVMSAVGGTLFWMFGNKQIERQRVQLMVIADHDDDARPAGAIWDSLVKRFENADLLFTDGTHIVMRRESMPIETVDTDVVQLSGDWFLEQQT